MNTPRVHIILLNWNGWRDTIECLESLLRQDYANYQIVVCDNASDDDSLGNIEAWARGELEASHSSNPMLAGLLKPVVEKPISFTRISAEIAKKLDTPVESPVVLIENGGNIGFAAGNNTGFRFALAQGTDYCWLLNNDTVVAPDALTQMVEHSTKLTNKGIPNTCGSVQMFYDDPSVVQALGGFAYDKRNAVTAPPFGRYKKLSELSEKDFAAADKHLDAIHGCSWLAPRAFLEEIGLMDERFFLYYEEIDWALRARNKFTLTYSPEAFVYHKEGASIGSTGFKRARSAFAEYHLIKSRMTFCRKHEPKKLIGVALYALMQAVNRIRQRRFANSRSILKAVFS